MNPFAALGLSPDLVRAIDESGYAEPTPIQVAAIPAILAGRDLLGMASTGSGKTAAFALPLLQQLESRGLFGSGRDEFPSAPASRRVESRTAAHPTRHADRRTHALIIVPTRELAAQVGEAVLSMGQFLPDPFKVSILFGGVSINPQMMALRGGADIVIATPGRLLDVVAQNALRLANVRCLVLDEADRLLDAGFADELTRVLAALPPRRQTLLFSATFPPALQVLADELLRDPVRIDIPREPEAQADIEEHAIEVDPARRTPLLRHMIERGEWTRVLVFVATKYACDHVADKLRRSGLEAAAFHGDSSQGARTKILADFKASRLRVLVATDLGARGIDIAQLPVVVNYDLPRSAVDHTHRIGRTARAGAKGLAVSFISATTEAHFRLIEKRQGRRIPRERIEGYEPTETATPEAATGGVKGKRPNKKDKLRAAASRDV